MGKPAARIGDMHVCPMFNGPAPHVGGPVIGPGVPTVLIGGMPAAVMGDMCTCAGPPDTIVLGSTGVLIGGKPAARMGDQCVHGGTIVVGLPTVLIGETVAGGGAPPAAAAAAGQVARSLPPAEKKKVDQQTAMKEAAKDGKPFCAVCNAIN